MDWSDVCPNDGRSEIYLISNPPYLGSSMQTDEQKRNSTLSSISGVFRKNLDYISLWFVKGVLTSQTRALSWRL